MGIQHHGNIPLNITKWKNKNQRNHFISRTRHGRGRSWFRNGSVEIDYDRITKACLRRLTGNDPDSSPYYVVYHADSTVGFANQFRAFAGVFLVALVTGRRLRSRIEKDDNI